MFSGLYSLRTCAYDLSKEKIDNNKYNVCLEYHIGNCLGGCEGFQKENDYKKYISNIRDFLKGNLSTSINYFKSEMKLASDSLDFEKAQSLKEKIELLLNYQSKSTVVSASLNNIDVFSIQSDSTHAYVNYFQVAFGRIVRFHNLEIKKKLDESDEDLLLLSIVDLRNKFNSNNKTIISLFDFKKVIPAKFIIPKAGEKKKLLDLSLKNVSLFKLEKLKQVQIVDPERHSKRVLNQMKVDLRLPSNPIHIECFDNSNIQGSNPVAACIVFKNGKASKKDYRHYNIKTVEGPDDYASMEEVVYRRYKRLIEEKIPLPNLIIIDGGKGQLSSSIIALKKLNIDKKIAILGIAKRLEEIYYPNDPIPLYLDKKSETLKLIQQMRNEAHRFAINFHRNKRSNQALNSSLDSIPGIGEKTKITLLKKFKSLKNIKELSIESLILEIGKSRAKKLMSFLNPNN
jgi:excinuclease ABC subunit C